jgi:hypothetical protein
MLVEVVRTASKGPLEATEDVTEEALASCFRACGLADMPGTAKDCSGKYGKVGGPVDWFTSTSEVAIFGLTECLGA